MTGSVVQYAFTPAAIIMKVFNTEISIYVMLCALTLLIHSFIDTDICDSILNEP